MSGCLSWFFLWPFYLIYYVFVLWWYILKGMFFLIVNIVEMICNRKSSTPSRNKQHSIEDEPIFEYNDAIFTSNDITKNENEKVEELERISFNVNKNVSKFIDNIDKKENR